LLKKNASYLYMDVLTPTKKHNNKKTLKYFLKPYNMFFKLL